MQKVRERAAAIETELLFFELEWNEVDDEPAASSSPPMSSTAGATT